MAIEVDHMILAVNDRTHSIDFYVGILGLKHEGERDSFSVIRLTPEFTLQVAPSGTKGREHLSFAMSRKEFDTAIRKVIDRGIPYGESCHAVGNIRGPGNESAARGAAQGALFSRSEQASERNQALRNLGRLGGQKRTRWR